MYKNEKRVKEKIDKDLAEHVVTVLHNDGMYHHWLCSKPQDSNMSFNVVTWPGHLCYTGDMGDYLFHRTNTDMVAFMRGSAMSYCYAAEKCIAHGTESWGSGIEEWSEEIFNETLAQTLKESEDNGGKYSIHKNGKLIEEDVAYVTQDIRNQYEISGQHGAIEAMYESELWDEIPTCMYYTFRFLWCLHALKWFCERVE